jgi:hypothetical protein
MFEKRTLSNKELKKFDFEGTKSSVRKYFENLENIEWELAKINIQKGMTANYDLAVEYKNNPYIRIGKDEFCLSAKEYKEDELKNYLFSYYWGKSFLTDKEQIYIHEHFVNHRYEYEISEMIGCAYPDDYEFRKIKKSAVYKFANFLNLIEGKK